MIGLAPISPRLYEPYSAFCVPTPLPFRCRPYLLWLSHSNIYFGLVSVALAKAHAVRPLLDKRCLYFQTTSPFTYIQVKFKMVELWGIEPQS